MTPDNRGDPAAARFRFTNHHMPSTTPGVPGPWCPSSLLPVSEHLAARLDRRCLNYCPDSDIEAIPETPNAGTAVAPVGRFHPRTGPGEVPMLQNHGFEINAYEDAGSLIVSIDSEAAESMCHDDGTPDLMVIVNEARIYDDTTQARTGGTAFTAYVTDAAPEPWRIHLLQALSDSLAGPGSSRPDSVTISITREQLEAWAGEPLTDEQVTRIDACIPQSSIPDAIAAIAAQFPSDPDADDR
jgi:hypothetical protein